MANDAKIIRDLIALESFSGGDAFRKSMSGAEAGRPDLKPVAMASGISGPSNTGAVNSTTAPTPTASLAIGPRK